MRRAALIAALAAFGSVFAASRPNVVVKPNAIYARRGSLGANDYVATNVAPCASAYAIREVRDGRLHDRAVNVATVDGTEAEFALPSRRTVAGFARGLIVSVTASTSAVVRFTGANSLYRSDGEDTLSVKPGLNVFSFIEIGDGDYIVEVRLLVPIREGN